MFFGVLIELKLLTASTISFFFLFETWCLVDEADIKLYVAEHDFELLILHLPGAEVTGGNPHTQQKITY